VTDSLNPSAWPSVTVDSLGNAIVVYAANHGGRAPYGRRFNAAGIPLGPEARADVGATTDAFGPSVAAGPNGYVVAWSGPSARFYRTATAGDADGDGVVNFNDLVHLAQNYNVATGKTWVDGDFNGDGAVDFNDLVMMAQRYNTSSASPGAPATTSFEQAFAAASALSKTDQNSNPSPAAPATRRPNAVAPKPKVVVTRKKPASAPARPLSPRMDTLAVAPKPAGVFSTRRVPLRKYAKDLFA
jgi:hypothetical protein